VAFRIRELLVNVVPQPESDPQECRPDLITGPCTGGTFQIQDENPVGNKGKPGPRVLCDYSCSATGPLGFVPLKPGEQQTLDQIESLKAELRAALEELDRRGSELRRR
jgi:hypothetical protein